jgi:hypothetical protein
MAQRDAGGDGFEAFIAEVTQYQSGFAQRGDGEAHRSFHVKTHAGLRGEFVVSPDIPDAAKHGVFAQARSFPACVRFSNGYSAVRPDWFPDLLGLAVKLVGVGDPKLLAGEESAQTQDFLTLNQPYVPASDASQFIVISLSAANLFTAPFRIIGGLGLGHGLQVLLWTLGWSLRRFGIRSVAAQTYSGILPISIGPNAVKFTWQPQQTSTGPSRVAGWRRNYLREEFKRRLRTGNVGFDFMVQFYVDPHQTPLDGAMPWDTREAPFVKLAELRLAQRDLDATSARIEEKYIDALSFNPWHAVAAHRPAGNVQPARGPVYQHSAGCRGRAPDPGVGDAELGHE